MFYTYVLKSEKGKKLYVGFTKDLKQRFEQHQKGRVDATKDRIKEKSISDVKCQVLGICYTE